MPHVASYIAINALNVHSILVFHFGSLNTDTTTLSLIACLVGIGIPFNLLLPRLQVQVLSSAVQASLFLLVTEAIF